ncbi:MAG: ribbon-helix-helix protein, CopG family [Archaeoglobaceae archaeon]
MEIGKMKRLTVSLDDDTIAKLEQLARKDNRSLSEIVRSAISSYYELNQREAIIVDFDRFIELIASREHVAVDIGLWIAIMDEINEKASDSFWEIVEKVGSEYGLQFKEMGLKDLRSVLKFLETTNWFKVRMISDSTYSLVLTARSEVKLIKKFLEGLLKSMSLKAEISEGLRKVMIKLL